MNKMRLISLPILLLLLTSINATSSRTFTPGVAEGDYFTYEMYGIYTSSIPNNTIIIPEFEKNNTHGTQIKITAVAGSTIKQTYTLYFKNDSEYQFDFETDVNPQNQELFKISEKGVPVCAANLNPGDKIPTAKITLNDTVNRAYLDGKRELIHARWSQTDEQGDIYFDRETGMLVELERTHQFINPYTGNVIEKTDVIELIDTNKWQVR
jgi:hypothetical protein